MNQRIWLLDGLRAMAICVVVLYHFLFDLEVFYFQGIGIFEYPWPIFRVFWAGVFVFLAGYSSTLSRRPAKQGFLLLVAAVVITAVSFWFTPYAMIYFGILHLLGVCYLLSAGLFVRCSFWLNLILGGLILLLPNYIGVLPIYLLPLGGGGQYFSMMDYFPLVPWLGIFLWGVAAGQLRLFASFVSTKESWLLWPGRHSLLIYFIHQPILLGLLRLYYGN